MIKMNWLKDLFNLIPESRGGERTIRVTVSMSFETAKKVLLWVKRVLR